MKCVYCRDDLSPIAHSPGTVECPLCGLLYATELLQAADPKTWNRIVVGLDGHTVIRTPGNPPTALITQEKL